jgi:hypothetical protein
MKPPFLSRRKISCKNLISWVCLKYNHFIIQRVYKPQHDALSHFSTFFKGYVQMHGLMPTSSATPLTNEEKEFIH